MPRNSTTCHGERRSAWSGSVRSEPTRPGAEPRRLEIAESSVIGARSMSITAPSRPNSRAASRPARASADPAEAPRRSTTPSGWSRRASRPRSETRSRPRSAAWAAGSSRERARSSVSRPASAAVGSNGIPTSAATASRAPATSTDDRPWVIAQVTDCSTRSTPLSGCARLGRNRSARSTSSSSAASSMVTWRAFSRLDADGDEHLADGRGVHRLDRDDREPARQRAQRLDELLVLLGGRRADDRDVAAGQRWLEALRDVVDGGQREDVHLVEEHDDRRVARLLEQVLDDAGARLGRGREPEQRDVVDARVAERLGHLAAGDADRQPLDDRRLPRPGRADERRVALRPPEQHADQRADLAFAPDDGAELAGLGQRRPGPGPAGRASGSRTRAATMPR